MKHFLITILVIVITNFVWAQDAVSNRANEVIHWVDKDEKLVQFVASSKLKITLQKMEMSNGIQGLLFVTLHFDPGLLQENLAYLGARYPGYELRRIWPKKGDDFTLDIPMLDIRKKAVHTYPGVDGPYFETLFEVPARLLAQLERQMKSTPQNVVKIIGVQGASRIKNILKERVELPVSTCNELARGGNMYAALLEFANIIKEVRSLTYRYTSTRDQLEKQILISCLNINIQQEVNSFVELLSQKVELKSGARSPVGETYRREHVMDWVPVSAQVYIEVNERP